MSRPAAGEGEAGGAGADARGWVTATGEPVAVARGGEAAGAGGAATREGRAAERTALAWTRSSLSLAVVAGLMLHSALAATEGHPIDAVAAVGLVGAAAAVWHHGATRYRRGEHDGDRRAIAAMTALTVVTAAVALAVVLRV